MVRRTINSWHDFCLVSEVRLFLSSILLFSLFLMEVRSESTSLAEFPFRFEEGLVWIRVRVPQSAEPLNFLLDSGAGVSVINLGTAQRLKVKLGNRVSVRGVDATTPGYWPQRLAARMGDITLPAQYLAVDLSDLSGSCKCAVDGLLGADFFREHVVQIDFQARRIRLLNPAARSATSETLALECRPCGLRVPLQVNGGEQQWVRLDTGCASALQWVTSQAVSTNCSHQVAIGLNKLSLPLAETRVKIGRTEFNSVLTGLHEKEIFMGEAGLLGNGLLSRFATVTIDAAAGRLILEKVTALE